MNRTLNVISVAVCALTLIISTGVATYFVYGAGQKWLSGPIEQFTTSSAEMASITPLLWLAGAIGGPVMLSHALRRIPWASEPEWIQSLCKGMAELAFLQAFVVVWVQQDTLGFFFFSLFVLITYRWAAYFPAPSPRRKAPAESAAESGS